MFDWISVTTGLVIAAIFILYFTFRKPMPFDRVAEHNRALLRAATAPADVLNRIASLARGSNYRMMEENDQHGRLVLEEPWSIFNYGALFEVEAKPNGSGGSDIHVAIVGRGYQWGPAFQRSKRRFLDWLKGAVSALPD